MSGRPVRSCSPCPRTCCVTAPRSPTGRGSSGLSQGCDEAGLEQLADLLATAERPLAIVGGGGWDNVAAQDFAAWADRTGIDGRHRLPRQDAIPNACPAYAGNLGYGPNPALVARVKAADLCSSSARGSAEATTDGYTLITPIIPAAADPRPSRCDRTRDDLSHTDLAICAGMAEFAEALARSTARRIPAAPRLMPNGWPGPTPRTPRRRGDGSRPLRRGDASGVCRRTRSCATARAITAAGGTATGAIRRPARSSPRPPARWAMASPPRSPAALRFPSGRCRARRRRLFPDERAGTRHRGQHDAQMLVLVIDNGGYGTIRMHHGA